MKDVWPLCISLREHHIAAHLFLSGTELLSLHYILKKLIESSYWIAGYSTSNFYRSHCWCTDTCTDLIMSKEHTCPVRQDRWRFRHCSWGSSPGSGSSPPGQMGHICHLEAKRSDPRYVGSLDCPRISKKVQRKALKWAQNTSEGKYSTKWRHYHIIIHKANITFNIHTLLNCSQSRKVNALLLNHAAGLTFFFF